MVRVKLTKRYYKRSRPGEEPIKYKAKQPGGVGSTVHATIHLDPVLKKHPDLRKAMISHEINEIKDWASGKTGSHKKARKKEPKLTRNIGGVSGFWKEIRRRGR